jgi:hypothetical protein
MRFPIIKEPMRLQVINIRKVFMTCVILHNFLINMGMGYFEEVGDAAGLEAWGVNAAGGYIAPAGVEGDQDDEDYTVQDLYC